MRGGFRYHAGVRISPKSRIVPLLCAAALLAAPKPAAAERSSPFEWRGVLAPGTRIQVGNIDGSIVARPVAGSQARVSAQRSSQTDDPSAVTIHVHQSGNTLYICPVYPGDSVRDDCSSLHSTWNRQTRVRVDFTLGIPNGAPVELSAVNGRIDAQDLDSEVSAKTVNQSISISTRRRADAKSVNGSIDARIGVAHWTGDLSFKTVNGNVNLVFPSNAGFVATVKTLNGAIHVDGLSEQPRRFVGHSLEGTVGDGGGTLAVKTLNGAVDVRRL